MVAKRLVCTIVNNLRVIVLCGATAAINFATDHSVKSQCTITYIGVIRDQTDFKKLSIGNAGYWFPQFGAKSPETRRPTGENARNALPPWVAPLNHVTSIFDPAFK